jgi:hypothetical protein
LAKTASALAGTHVTVHCQTAGETFVDTGAELGYVRFTAAGRPEHRTVIKREPCHDLSAYARSDKRRPSDSQVVAVHVLTHESMHMAGLTNEAEAECAAVQRDARTAELLGAEAAPAVALARRYWQSMYPRMPDDYRSSDCRRGGRLDEHLADAPWS